MLRNLLLSVCLLLVSESYGQIFILEDSTQISYPAAASIDRLNNIYIADQQGNLKQYAQGKLHQSFSPQKSGDITLIEAWNPLKILLFYADLQEYLFLDRFITGSQRYALPNLVHFAGLLTISNDNNLWIIDDVAFSLKKYNINFREFTLSTPFDLLLDHKNYEITFMREYQNLVFISDKNSGILIFDNLGNYLRKIPALGVDYFSFNGDNLNFISGNELVAINIYNHTKVSLKLPEEALFAFRYDNQLALITENALKLYLVSQ